MGTGPQPTIRRTHAEALTAVSAAVFTTARGAPESRIIRTALTRWGFNTARRQDPNQPTEIADALHWIERHTLPVSALAKPEVLRPVLDGLTMRLDGTPYAPSVVSRRWKILGTAMEYAVERKLLQANPIPALKWTAPRTVHTVDRRSVANPAQVRTLLAAVNQQQRSGPRLVAFFACLYFAALRPEEAVALAKSTGTDHPPPHPHPPIRHVTGRP